MRVESDEDGQQRVWASGMAFVLPKGLHLCRLVDVEDSAQPPVPVPDDVREAINEALKHEYYKAYRGGLWDEQKKYKAALAWLDSVTAQPQE
jgi:hypothetical protein